MNVSQSVSARMVAGIVAIGCGILCSADEREPYGIEKRIPWTTSAIHGTPHPPLPYVTERVFPELTFDRPVDLMPVPGTDRMLMVQLGGEIVTFADRQDLHVAADIGELPDAKAVGSALRVYGFAFHPDFLRNRQCFVCYVLKAGDPNGTRVSRFEARSTNPLTIDLASEQIIVSWLGGGHNGGSLQFGPRDGMLYISTGDGAPAFPPDIHRSGQDISDLLASVLRIDVDHPSKDRLYSIPQDNPFVNTSGARGEVWTYGHRNPWRMSFDPATGDLWIGDVGWEMWEMIYRAKPGANFGWSLLEHSQPVHPNDQRGPTPITPPAAAHSHTESRSITGGHVCRGDRLPELTGQYIYGDYVTGKIWGLDAEAETATPCELADTTLQIICFGVGRKRELYIVAYDGTLHRLVTNPRAGTDFNFPRALSKTGLFESTGEHRLQTGVIPYAVNAEPWADGTIAQRFLALPGDTTLGVHAKNNIQMGNVKGDWSFPEGTVLGKTIILPTGQYQQRRLETQVLHRYQDQWEAYSYIWNDDQTDATLLEGRGFDRTFGVGDATQTWHFSSRTECILCHTTRGGSVYGFRASQLNRDFRYDSGVTDNQLRTMAHIGIFEQPLVAGHNANEAPVDELPRMNGPWDEAATLDQRARSYLHLNCATCHRRGGGGTASIELVLQHSLEKTRLVSRPTQGTFGLVDAWVVAPGDPVRSVLYYRMAKLGRGRMPHFGSQMIDEDGVLLIRDWIRSLTPSGDQIISRDARRLQAAVSEALPGFKFGALSPDTTAIERLLASTNGALALSMAVRDGSHKLSETARKKIIETGAAHNDATVRDLFEAFVPESQRTRRLGTTIDAESLLSMNGNLNRGRSLFQNSKIIQCRNCHRAGNHGRALGPDLDRIGTRQSRREILTNILDPSRKIDPAFQTWTLVMTSGKVHSGLLARKTDDETLLRDVLGKEIRVAADDIEVLIAQKKSLMPELLLRDVTPQDAADLLAWLASLK